MSQEVSPPQRTRVSIFRESQQPIDSLCCFKDVVAFVGMCYLGFLPVDSSLKCRLYCLRAIELYTFLVR
jgi:hypothetical protein